MYAIAYADKLLLFFFIYSTLGTQFPKVYEKLINFWNKCLRCVVRGIDEATPERHSITPLNGN